MNEIGVAITSLAIRPYRGKSAIMGEVSTNVRRELLSLAHVLETRIDALAQLDRMCQHAARRIRRGETPIAAACEYALLQSIRQRLAKTFTASK